MFFRPGRPVHFSSISFLSKSCSVQFFSFKMGGVATKERTTPKKEENEPDLWVKGFYEHLNNIVLRRRELDETDDESSDDQNEDDQPNEPNQPVEEPQQDQAVHQPNQPVEEPVQDPYPMHLNPFAALRNSQRG